MSKETKKSEAVPSNRALKPELVRVRTTRATRVYFAHHEEFGVRKERLEDLRGQVVGV